jgi:hypothetical protein
VDQSEWATDILFRSADDLAALYPRLLRHGLDTLHSEDVMRFLGRGLTPTGKARSSFEEQVTTDFQRRPEGARLKHRLGANSLKMYDKAYDAAGAVLRLEATYNDVRAIKVFRPKEGDPRGPKAWLPLRKGVADVSRRADVSQKATARYAEALATVEDKAPLKDLVDGLCRPVRWKGRRARALNPLNQEDAALLEAVSRGEFLLDGFRNRDLRGLLYAAAAAAPADERRRSSRGDAPAAAAAGARPDPESAQEPPLSGQRARPHGHRGPLGGPVRRHGEVDVGRLRPEATICRAMNQARGVGGGRARRAQPLRLPVRLSKTHASRRQGGGRGPPGSLGGCSQLTKSARLAKKAGDIGKEQKRRGGRALHTVHRQARERECQARPSRRRLGTARPDRPGAGRAGRFGAFPLGTGNTQRPVPLPCVRPRSFRGRRSPMKTRLVGTGGRVSREASSARRSGPCTPSAPACSA